MRSDQSDHNSQEWIPSGRALALIIARTGNEEVAIQLLNNRLLDGAFRLRAKAVTEQINFGPLPTQVPAGVSDMTTRVRILPEGKYASLLVSPATGGRDETGPSWQANWKTGVFAVVNPPASIMIKHGSSGSFTSPIAKRFVFFSVEFLRSEIHKFSLSIPPLVRRTSGVRGPRTKKWNFAPLLAQLEDAILNDQMEQQFGAINQYGTQANIQKYLRVMVTGKDGEPPPGTTRRKARDVMDQWRKHVARKANEPL